MRTLCSYAIIEVDADVDISAQCDTSSARGRPPLRIKPSPSVLLQDQLKRQEVQLNDIEPILSGRRSILNNFLVIENQPSSFPFQSTLLIR